MASRAQISLVSYILKFPTKSLKFNAINLYNNSTQFPTHIGQSSKSLKFITTSDSCNNLMNFPTYIGLSTKSLKFSIFSESYNLIECAQQKFHKHHLYLPMCIASICLLLMMMRTK